ncbi:MAG: LLM class flavin-dependent oxidoreductase [Myxococcales bacterium]|nr:LLM class flavin-dependent oxidoreductase [Myxococcales bacterium]
MDVGLLMIFQNYLGRGKDADMVRGEMAIAERAEDLGFDKLWPAEHHFTDYSACPDNVQFLTWLAGRTSTLRLGTGAIIVPWNDPLRVVEKIAFLDHLSGGRAVLGLGRGLARTEYHHFQIDMSESRDRFDEASRMIIEALDTGVIRGDGPYYPQVETPIRPAPLSGFRDRFYCVGMSPDSVEQCAALGARLMTFSQKPWELYRTETLDAYQRSYRGHHGTDAPPPLTGDLMLCHADPQRAEALAREYMANYFLTIVSHYELMSEHFTEANGYDYYASAAELFRAVGVEPAVQSYVDVQCWGSPDQVLEKLRKRWELLGGFELNLIASYGGLPVPMVQESLSLFAKEVLPELQSWQ